uniref:TATA-box binding protein n=1 Tax=viral metagenome TaxID=1070528 RepID=A0A6C0ABY6_9ZZZZ
MMNFVSYKIKDDKSDIVTEIANKYEKNVGKEHLPSDVTISTMTISCHMDTKFKILEIGKYIDLDPSTIVSCKDGGGNIRTVLIQKKKRRNTKKKDEKKVTFYNQTSILVKPSKEKNPINIKLFKNGSIQMTGVKSVRDCISALNILFRQLYKSKGIMYKNEIKIVDFVTSKEDLSIDKIKDFKICMINSGFKIGFKLNRDSLYKILSQDESIKCKYDLDNHACVDVKYFYKERKKISIFIFEKGSIIITGANNCNHIQEAYKYITSQLYKNYKKIKSIEPNIKINDIRNYLKSD